MTTMLSLAATPGGYWKTGVGSVSAGPARVARVRIAHTIDCELPTAEFQISHGTNATQETLNVTMSRRDYVVDIGRAVGIVPMCCKVVGVIDVILAPVS